MSQKSCDFPLSIEQQQILYPYGIEHGTSDYTVGIVTKFHGLLNQEAFTFALREVVDCNEILKATVKEENGKLMSCVSSSFDSIYSTRDYSNLKLNDSALTAHAHKLFILKMNKAFNLKKGPLLKLILLKYSSDLHVLLLSVHHIIFDGRSVQIFFHNIADLYNLALEQKASSLKFLSQCTYRDFVEKQNKPEYRTSINLSLDYWKSHLAGLSSLELPTDKPRNGKEPAIKLYRFSFAPTMISQFTGFADAYNVTVFNLILSSFGLLLSLYSGQNDFTVGVPLHGRTQEEVKETIGLFVKILPIRISLDKTKSFINLAHQTQLTVRQAHNYHQVPLLQLIHELNLDMMGNKEPLYQTSLNFQNTSVSFYNFQGLECKTLDVGGGQLPLDIDVEIYPNTGIYNPDSEYVIDSYAAYLKYDSNLYTLSTIKNFVYNWQELLNEVLAAPNKQVEELMANMKVIKHCVLGMISSANKKKIFN